MQNYQCLWPCRSPTEVMVDWDDFILNFARQMLSTSNYLLNQLQMEYIKCKIDPQHRNQIYKSAFLLFLRDYWSIPSNRHNLLKMRIRPSALHLMTATHPNKIQILVSSPPQIPVSFPPQLLVFSPLSTPALYFFQDTLTRESPLSVCATKCKHFLSVGSAPTCDITLPNPYVNGALLKIFTHSSHCYLKALSRSQHLKYALDTPFKHVVLLPQMVISLSLTDEYIMVVKRIAGREEDCPQVCSQKQEERVLALLNADRIDYLGEVDQSVPYKQLVRMKFAQPHIRDIEQMYRGGHYYPVEEGEGSKSEEVPSLEIEVINTKTLNKVNKIIRNGEDITVGRSRANTFPLQWVEIRRVECKIVLVGNVWVIKNVGENCGDGRSSQKGSQRGNILGVYLQSKQSMEQGSRSQKLRIKQQNDYKLVNKGVKIRIRTIIQAKTEQE